MSLTLTIPKLLDMHVHLRNGEVLKMVVPYIARHFRKYLVMPNTRPQAVLTPEQLLSYQHEILAVLNELADAYASEPLMTFEIRQDTDPNDLIHLKRTGAVAGKVYPRGLTTNAEHGVEDYAALSSVLAEMERLELVLCLHGEQPGEAYEGLDRERVFVEQTLPFLATHFPRLRIVLEHVSTAAGCAAVLQWPNVAGTITVHHLLLTHDDVGGDRLSPNNFCKPVAKTRADRAALLRAATWGHPKFFFGSDSAPHLREGKEKLYDCCAGIFTSPVALPLLAKIFEEHGALRRLRTFGHDAAAHYYRLVPSRTVSVQASRLPTLTLVKEPWTVPDEIGGVVPFCAGETLPWHVAEIAEP